MLEPINVDVLLIEDDEASAQLTKDFLQRSESANFNVDIAWTVSEALSILEGCDKYDVILLDLVLPNGEGLDVFKRVKQICPDRPIVIVSGYEDKAIECVRHGAQDYLIKPYYDSRALSRSIRYAIERDRWEKKYRKLVDGTHAAIYEIDFISNKFTYINDVALLETGYTKKEVMKMSPTDFLTEESVEKWMHRLQKIQAGEEIDNIEEYQIRKKDGSLMWVLITADYKYENGFIVGASVVAIDITDKKIKENQVESIYKTAPVAIGLLGKKRTIIEVNDRLCEMLGYNKEEVVNKSIRMLYPDDKEYCRVGKIKYLKIKEEGIGVVETQWRKKNGELIDILLTSTYLDHTDRSRGVTFSALDITKTKQMEREIERELNKRLDSWKSEVGVDFQNLNKLDSILSL